MNRRTSSIYRLAAAVIACGLMPATVWADRKPSEAVFDPVRGQVTVRVSPRQLQDVRVPFPLRERLTVIEDGVRQLGVSVHVEHSPITLAVLIENGGRSHQLNESVTADAGMLLRPLLDRLDEKDRLGVFAYDESVRTVVDFDAPHNDWALALGRLPKPRFSEANFYDATISVLDRLASASGRKALLILSTGIDTFSRASHADVITRADQADVPIYVLNLGELARRRLSSATSGLLARVDWVECERQLGRLADASGGRAYLKADGTDVKGIYDEIIEDLKVQYVLTYAPSLTPSAHRRTVQVAVLEPGTSPLTGASRRHRNEPRVIAEATYTRAVNVATAGSAVAGTQTR